MASFKGGSGFTGNGDFFSSAGFPGGDDPQPGGQGRDPRLPLFAQGRSWDTAAPSTWLAMNVSDVSRPGPLDAASDDEALGILRKWRSLESWATSRKLALARELIRRHPMPGTDTPDDSGHCLPGEWDPRLGREVSAALGISLVGAAKLLRLAWSLEARLPRVGQALHEDRLDLSRVRTIIEETEVLLDPDKLAKAEEMILAGLDKCRTWSDFLRMIQHAVITVDPEGAEKRRKLAEREHARVHFWRENSGTCGLQGTGLPTDEALAASAHIEARAQKYKAAGIKRYMDLLRVMAMLDLLSGVPVSERVARCRAEDAAADQDAQAEQAAKDARLRKTTQAARARSRQSRASQPSDGASGNQGSTSDTGSHDSPDNYLPDDHDVWDLVEPPCSNCGASECRCGASTGYTDNGTANYPDSDHFEDGPGNWPRDGDPGNAEPDSPEPDSPEPCGSGFGSPEPGFGGGLPIRGNLTFPLDTLLGQAERAGEAHGFGALDPALVRDLAKAGAGHPDSEFCITITDEHGYAVAHGCCKPMKQRQTAKPGRTATGKIGKDPPNGPAPPAPPSSSSSNPDRATFTRPGKPGPNGGLGSWILTLPGAPHPFSVDIEPVPTYTCDHRHESKGHDPSEKLRHLIQVRDGKCSFVTCSRHARESDFEHATPYDKGGRTCGCNCHMCSRSCHRAKQSAGWSVASPLPGFHQWTTGFGRTYIQAPWAYPS